MIAIFQHPVAMFMAQVYTLFTVLKCNLVFVFRCFLHYYFHATYFGNSLPSSGVVPLTISLQFFVRIDAKLKYKKDNIREQNEYILVYINLGDFPVLKLFHVLDLPKSGIVVMQLFVCGCVSYPWSAMLYHL
jgi:hypothetical protein